MRQRKTAEDRHVATVTKLCEWVSDMYSPFDEARDACNKYSRTIRNSRLPWNLKSELRTQLSDAVNFRFKAEEIKNKPKLTLIQGGLDSSIPVSRRSRAELRLVS